MTEDISHGRRVRTVVAAGIGVAFGRPAIMLYTTGIFFEPIAREIGLTRAQFGAGLLTMTISIAVTVPIVGLVVDRIGPRRAVLAGPALLALGFAVLAWLTTSPATYIAGMALIGALGAVSTPVAYTRAVAASFDRARGTAMGATLTIVGVGSAILPLVAAAGIDRFGWRGALLCLAALALLATPLSFLWLRPPPDKPIPKVSTGTVDPGRHFLRDLNFWLMMAGFTLVATALFGFMVHLVPFAQSAGIGVAEATRYASVLGISGLASRLIVGLICDLVRPQLVLFCCVIAAAIAAVVVAIDPQLMLLAAIAFGFVIGAEIDLMSILAARYYAGPLYGRVYAMLYAPTIVGTGVSSLWIGALADQQGYPLPLMLGALFGAVGGCLFLLLPKAPLPVHADTSS